MKRSQLKSSRPWHWLACSAIGLAWTPDLSAQSLQERWEQAHERRDQLSPRLLNESPVPDVVIPLPIIARSLRPASAIAHAASFQQSSSDGIKKLPDPEAVIPLPTVPAPKDFEGFGDSKGQRREDLPSPFLPPKYQPPPDDQVPDARNSDRLPSGQGETSALLTICFLFVR